MSEEVKSTKDEVASDREASKQGSNSQQKTDYAKWIGIIATFLSIFLAFLTYRLEAERRNAEAQLEKSEKRREEISANLEEIRGKVEVDYNFYFEGAATTGKKIMESNTLSRIFPNEVYDQIVIQMKKGGWEELNNLMRCVYGVYHENPNYGAINSRQVLYFEIFYNPSPDSKKPPAEKLEITYNFKDFRPIPASGSLTRQFSFNELEAEVNTWQTKTVELGQLKAGNKITVPVAHMVGPYVYSERLVMPIKISWYNPLLKRNEEKSLDYKSVMSELGAKSEGFLLGNIGQSCQ